MSATHQTLIAAIRSPVDGFEPMANNWIPQVEQNGWSTVRASNWSPVRSRSPDGSVNSLTDANASSEPSSPQRAIARDHVSDVEVRLVTDLAALAAAGMF
ncbi:MAG: hypothetical protein ABIR62_13395 [Dokdonella sp.]|uniref:hypothetical protein n=1 Tax=Dokdonella sp. TaxID=2291710 RepID=UPI003262D694